MLGEGHPNWDVIEFKLLVLLITAVAAIWLGNMLYNKNKDKDL